MHCSSHWPLVAPILMKSRPRPIVLPLTLLLQHLLLKLLAQLLIVLLKPLLRHRAPLTRHSLPRQHRRHVAKPTKKAWSVCSRSRCPSNQDQDLVALRLQTALFERRACRGVFYAPANDFGDAVRPPDEFFDPVPVELPCPLSCRRNKLLGDVGQRILALRVRHR